MISDAVAQRDDADDDKLGDPDCPAKCSPMWLIAAPPGPACPMVYLGAYLVCEGGDVTPEGERQDLEHGLQAKQDGECNIAGRVERGSLIDEVHMHRSASVLPQTGANLYKTAC